MRGKHAARAANGRADQFADEVKQLRQQLMDAKSAHAAERADLKDQIQQLQNRLTREVRELAQTEVRRAEDGARESVTLERERQQANSKKALSLLRGTGWMNTASADDLAELCGLLGVQAGDVYGDDARRDFRRHTNRSIRMAASLIRSGTFHQTKGDVT